MSTTPDLSQRSDDDLLSEMKRMEGELKRRAEEREQAVAAARTRRNQAILSHRETLLDLLEHERTSCSDENPVNAYTTAGRRGASRCAKCFLLKLTTHDAVDVEMSLHLSARYLELHPRYEG